jgi:uncharacterized membrane protein YfcA
VRALAGGEDEARGRQPLAVPRDGSGGVRGRERAPCRHGPESSSGIGRGLRLLIVAGFLVAGAALLAGTSGFGFGLLAMPVLLLCGFSLPFAVTASLLISVATRVPVAWRLRHAIDLRRVALLVGGAVPGLWLGSRTLGAVDEHSLKVAVGLVIALAAAALALSERRPPRPRIRGLPVAAGFAGGLLGTTTSLTGVPPALLLARRRLPARGFIADLAVYFVATGAIGLAVLAVDGELSRDAGRAVLWWLPGVLLANTLGTSAALRLPADAFRRLTLGLAFVAGLVTAVSASP